MTNFVYLLGVLVFVQPTVLSVGAVVWQEKESTQEERPSKRPRVLGHPRSMQEQEAWAKVEGEDDIKKKSRLAKEYLEKFPSGGYVPYAHEILAIYYQQLNDLEKFFEHAEKALEELPNEAVLLASLSSAYADQQKPDEAIERGNRALDILPTIEATGQVSLAMWTQERAIFIANALYGVGTGYLFKAYTSGANREYTTLAIDHLEKAVEAHPEHDRAHFRLGFAYQMQDELEKAILAYARAAALGRANATMARQYLEQIYKAVHKNTKGVDKLISEQKKYFGSQMKGK